MKNTTFKPMARIVLVLMMLAVIIGGTSAYITSNFVPVEKYEALLTEKEAEVRKLKNQLAKNEEDYRLDIARLKGEVASLKDQNSKLKEKETAFNNVLKYHSNTKMAKAIFSRGGNQRILKVNKTEMNKSSNLTIDEIKFLLKGKPLYSAAINIYNWDKKGVNAFLTMGISQKESSFGSDTIGRNGFGTKNPKTGKYYKFDNLGQSVDRFASGMLNGYLSHGVTNLSDIQRRYCPPNSEWDEGVRGNIEVLYNKLQKNSIQTAVNSYRF